MNKILLALLLVSITFVGIGAVSAHDVVDSADSCPIDLNKPVYVDMPSNPTFNPNPTPIPVDDYEFHYDVLGLSNVNVDIRHSMNEQPIDITCHPFGPYRPYVPLF